MGEMNWYHATSDGRQVGPVTLAILCGKAVTGELGGGDLVWAEGMADWVEARRVPEIAAAIAPPATASAGDPYELKEAPAPFPSQQPAPQYPSPYAAAPAGYPSPYATQPGVLPYGTYRPNYAATPEYAGFWLRFCASFIDGLILIIPLVGVFIGIALALDIDIDSGPPNGPPSGEAIVFDIAIRVVFVLAGGLYFALQESSVHMATLGKRVCGIRATDMDGNRLTFARASGRYFGKLLSNLICYIGYIMAAFTERKQALHDIMASALVVKRPPS